MLLNAACAPPGPLLWVSLQRCCRHRCGCCCLQWLLLLMFILSFYPLKRIILTHQHACSHARSCLSASEMAETHAHARTHTVNMDSLMEDPLTLFLLTESILFILVQSPRSYSASLLFSSSNLSLSNCSSISASVWAQLWIRSLWVNL